MALARIKSQYTQQEEKENLIFDKKGKRIDR
jgi:hypothetical protein